MTSVDIAKANVAASAIQRCLRIRRDGGFCGRFQFHRVVRENRFTAVLSALPFLGFLLVALFLSARH